MAGVRAGGRHRRPRGPGGASEGFLTAEQIADVRASGLTAVNVTVSAVGVLTGAFQETVKGIAYWEQELALHPDVFLKVRSAADLQTAREGRTVATSPGSSARPGREPEGRSTVQ